MGRRNLDFYLESSVFFLSGSAAGGYNLPGSVFDTEFRCTFDLLKSIPSARNPSISVTEDFFAFNTGEPYQDKAHILDRDGRIVHSPRFGLSMGDGLSLARVVLTPEAMLDGRRIEEFFSRQFFLTEFWFLWSTLMGSLPQHSVIEFRRYMNRFLYLFPDLSDMRGVMRTPVNQHQFFIEPLVAWLRPRGVNFLTDTFVRDIGFAAAPARTTVNRLDYERRGTATSVEVALEDLVLVTTGSQAADLCAGSMTEVPSPRPSGPLGSTQHRNHRVLFRRALRVGRRFRLRQGLDRRPELIDQCLAVADLSPLLDPGKSIPQCQ